MQRRAFCLERISFSERKKVIHTVDESVHILLMDSGKIALDKRRKRRYNASNASALRRWGAVPKSFGSTVQFFDATESLGCMRSARARPDSSGQRSAIYRPDEDTYAPASVGAKGPSPVTGARHHWTAPRRKPTGKKTRPPRR